MQEEKPNNENGFGFNEFIEKAAPYIRTILQNWKKLLYINGAVAVISAAILLLFVKNYYDSTVTIMPDYGSSSILGSLGGLAAMAGINVGKTEPTEIYENLLYSESVLSPVIYAKYKTQEFDKPVNLIEYYEIEPKTVGEDEPKYLQERDMFLQIIEEFNKNIISSSVDKSTAILTATIRTHEPALSAEISNNLLKSLDEYVRTKRKSNAKEQRIYIEKRTDQVKDSLRLAEEVLKKFREQNRIVIAPQLLLEQTRLMRNVEILQTVYIELTKQMELVKLEEVKDSPIINIMEEVGIPIKKAGPKRSVFFIIIMFFSIAVSSMWIVHREKVIHYYRLIFEKLS